MNDNDIEGPLDGPLTLSRTESMLLDDLRWALAAVEQITGPEPDQLAVQLRQILASWTGVHGAYSDDTVVCAETSDTSHLYAPPHRRGTTEEGN